MRRLRKPLVGLLVLGLALGASACGDDDEDEDAATETTVATDDGDAAGGSELTRAEIRIEGSAFSEGATAAPGGTVSVSNQDGFPHTVTADEGDAFDVEVDGGGTGEFTAPDEPGTYAFHCEIHSQMKGELVVE